MTSSTDLAVSKNLVGHIPKSSNSELPPLSSLANFGGEIKNFPLITQEIAGLRSLVNTVRTGDADLRFYITTVQDG